MCELEGRKRGGLANGGCFNPAIGTVSSKATRTEATTAGRAGQGRLILEKPHACCRIRMRREHSILDEPDYFYSRHLGPAGCCENKLPRKAQGPCEIGAAMDEHESRTVGGGGGGESWMTKELEPSQVAGKLGGLKATRMVYWWLSQAVIQSASRMLMCRALRQ